MVALTGGVTGRTSFYSLDVLWMGLCVGIIFLHRLWSRYALSKPEGKYVFVSRRGVRQSHQERICIDEVMFR